ncbi:hypothetical protein GQ600_11567 [Phytophthora cactorum]|nr:hypothetical protein GQ600_11567 [Phytophthora cactorum]
MSPRPAITVRIEELRLEMAEGTSPPSTSLYRQGAFTRREQSVKSLQTSFGSAWTLCLLMNNTTQSVETNAFPPSTLGSETGANEQRASVL